MVERGEKRDTPSLPSIPPGAGCRGIRETGRRLNRAIHMAVVTRMRMDPETRAYVAKRTAQGRTPREIRRSLKRYLARQIYRQLNAANTPAAAA